VVHSSPPCGAVEKPKEAKPIETHPTTPSIQKNGAASKQATESADRDGGKKLCFLICRPQVASLFGPEDEDFGFTKLGKAWELLRVDTNFWTG
jgi:hypothetical protein